MSSELDSKPKKILTATLFVAGVPHANGNIYTEEALQKMAEMTPYSLFTERDNQGRLCLKARGHV